MKGRVVHRYDSWLDSEPFTKVHPVQPVKLGIPVIPKFDKSRGISEKIQSTDLSRESRTMTSRWGIGSGTIVEEFKYGSGKGVRCWNRSARESGCETPGGTL